MGKLKKLSSKEPRSDPAKGGSMGSTMTKLASKIGLESFDGSSKATDKSGPEGGSPELPVRERPVTRSMTGKLFPKKKLQDTAFADDTSEDEPLATPKKRKARNNDPAGQPAAKKSKTGSKALQKSSGLKALGSRIKERAKTFSIPSRPASKRGGKRIQPQLTQCEICLDDKAAGSFIKHYSCGDHSICTPCIRTYLLGRFELHPTKPFECPSCGEMWALNAVLQYLNLDEQERVTMATKSTDPKYRKCLAPGCDHGQVHQPGLRKPIVECEKCQAKSCFGHRVPWHESETCAQYIDRVNEERENETEEVKKARLMDEEAETHKLLKHCPNCEVSTSKTDGCDAIFCNECKRSYCSLCTAEMAAILRQGNHLHNPDCKHWREPGWDNSGDIQRGLTLTGVIGDGPPLVLDETYSSDEDDIDDMDEEHVQAALAQAGNDPSNFIPVLPSGLPSSADID